MSSSNEGPFLKRWCTFGCLAAVLFSAVSTAPNIGLLLWKLTSITTVERNIYFLLYVCLGIDGLLLLASLVLFYGVKMDKHYCLIPWIITSKTDMAAHICYAALNIIEKYKEDTEFDTKDIVFIATFSVRLCGMVLGMMFVNYKFQRYINRNRQDGKSARNTTETTEPVSPPSYKTDPPSYKEPITATDPFPKSAPPSYKHNDQPENRSQPENRLVNPSTNVINTRDSLPLLDGPQEWVNEVLFYRNICFPRITLNKNARTVDIEGAGDYSTSAADISLPATDYAVSIPATDYTDWNPSDLFHAPDGRCVQTTIPIFYAANMYRQLHRQLFAVEYGNANEEIPCEAAALRS